MSTVAILAALLAAASWAVASVAIGRFLGYGYVTPAAATLFKNALAAFCFFLAALAVGGRWPVGEAWGWLFLSGFLGFTVSDTLYFAAFRRCGVQTAATVMLLNVPIATLLAVPLAGDAVQTQIVPFMVVVLVGVLLVILDSRIAQGRSPGDANPHANYALGVLLAVAAAFAIGTSVPLGRGKFDDVGVCPGAFVRLVGGALGAVPVALLVGTLRRGTSASQEAARLVHPLLVAPGPASVWGRASLVGVGFAIVGLIPYHFALRELPGGVSALLFSATPLFTLPLSLLIGQRAGWVGILGTLVGFAGVAGILLTEAPEERLRDLRLEVSRLGFAGPASARSPTFVRGTPFERTGLPPVFAIADGVGGGQEHRVVLIGDDDPSTPREREVGADAAPQPLYVHWADVPTAARLASGGLLVATLQRLGDSAYAYGARLALEEDGPPARDLGWLHADDSAVEHGCVSLVALNDGGVLAVWLDGRELAGVPSGSRLYAREITADGRVTDEVLLDDLVSECCPTDAVLLDDGSVVVVYRNRTSDEVRDIWTVRREPNARTWSEPEPVHRDGWRIEGSPVNGPAVAAAGDVVAVVWFTQGGRAEEREVRLAFSTDGARTFAQPRTLVVDGTLGRVDVARAGGRRFVLTHLAVDQEAPTELATWEAMLVAPASDAAPEVSIAGAEPGRRSGRLDLVSAPSEMARGGRGSVHAVWTGQGGLQAARIDVVLKDDEAKAPPAPE
ncbi:MAG: DMT family transporter [Planctomycetota bacterium]